MPDTEPGTQAGAQPEFLSAESPRGTVTAAPIPGANVGTEADEMAAPSRGQLGMAAKRFVRHKMAMSGAIIFLVLLLGSIIVPIFWPYNYSTITNTFATGPSLAHPFGTDLIGHDMLAQVMAGTLTSMEVALLVAAISTVIGTVDRRARRLLRRHHRPVADAAHRPRARRPAARDPARAVQ